MGVVLTVFTHHGGSERFHVGCPGGAYTWLVSDDGHWLLIRSVSGVPREQIPMVGIKRLTVERCTCRPIETPATRGVPADPCECQEIVLTGIHALAVVNGRMHRLPPYECDAPVVDR